MILKCEIQRSSQNKLVCEYIYIYFIFCVGELFAQAPVCEYPGVEVEAVMDSSRYFVVKIVDPSGKNV